MKTNRWRKVLAAMAFAAASSTAYAGPYSFNDLIDHWGPFNLDSAEVTALGLSYQHSILDNGFTPGDTILEAFLELDFTNDLFDVKDLGLFTITAFEHVTAFFDGQSWYVGEVDNGQYTASIDVSLLADGLLNVTLKTSNLLETISLDHSRLYGTAVAAAVPEPGSLALLGVGLLGLGITRRLRSAA